MLFSLLMACWMDSSTLPALDINVINFTNEYLERDVEVRIYESPLLCPDGLPASFFLVLPKSEDILPVSVVFHSGAIFAAVVRLEGTGAVIAFDAFTLVFLGRRAYLISLTTTTLLP